MVHYLQKTVKYDKILYENKRKEIFMPKFFIKSNQIENEVITILGEDVKHISNVLRAKIGDSVHVCNIDDSSNYSAEIFEIQKESIKCKIVEKIESEAESKISITIFQGVPKSDKMELIIQKSVELGVKEITPVQMERCVSIITGKDEKKKIERWQKISEVAAKQSGRDIIPKINNCIKVKDLCNSINKYNVLIVPYEKEENNSFNSVLNDLKESSNENISIGIVIGPEGGFEEHEIELLKLSGAKIVTLGKRILRTETVALAMTSVIMYEFGGCI